MLDKHKSKFNENFADNKKQLDKVAIIRSKGLKNEIAGYITNFIKKEHFEQTLKQSQEDKIKEQSQLAEEIGEEIENDSEMEETVIEIGVDEEGSEDESSEEE